jgi:hypothetical protein
LPCAADFSLVNLFEEQCTALVKREAAELRHRLRHVTQHAPS